MREKKREEDAIVLNILAVILYLTFEMYLEKHGGIYTGTSPINELKCFFIEYSTVLDCWWTKSINSNRIGLDHWMPSSHTVHNSKEMKTQWLWFLSVSTLTKTFL